MAFLKYDKNKPERLSYLADVDVKTGKREEWHICTTTGGSLAVYSNCTSPGYVDRILFRELV